MKYPFAVLVVGVIVVGSLLFWQDVAEAPHNIDGSTDNDAVSPNELMSTSTPSSNLEVPASGKPTACSMEAKLCPDGSAVGRSGPNCEFAACPAIVLPPEASAEAVTCTAEIKQVDACIEIYAPVCGLVEVQCIKAPCYPVPETFSNGCHACAQKNVISYSEGACQSESN